VPVGDEAVVAVAVATMWTAPEVVRPVDAVAVADAPDVGAWVGGMTVADLLDLDGRTLTQLLLGERVQVESVADGWARVIAVEQPAASLDARGYPGFVRLAHLAAPRPASEHVVVAALATALRDGPDGDVIMPGVVIGTRLPTAGEAEQGWIPVELPSGVAWVLAADVAPAPARPPGGEDVLAVAAQFVGVPYVWGGMSAYGIDCSGLVHLAYRRLGVTVPRDADDQASASEPLGAGQEEPGDLYFFAADGKPVHHVGLVAGPGRSMLHASGQSAAGRVVRETMTPDRAAGLSGTHRVPR
jgi:cell wall-associated NlpC family hydrolase